MLLIRLLIIFFFASSCSAQQAWTRPKGDWYSQLGVSYIGYHKLLDGNKDLQPLWRHINDFSVQLYADYGITDRLTLNANIPLKIINSSSRLQDSSYLSQAPIAAHSLVALGNVSIGFSYAILKKGGFSFIAHLRSQLHSARFHQNSGLRSGVAAWGFLPSLAIGFAEQYFFVSTELGSNFRTDRYSTQLFAYSQLGTKFEIGKANWLYIILSVDLIYSLHNGDYNNQSSIHTGLYLNNMQFQAPSLKLGFQLPCKLGFWLSTGGLALAGGKELGVGPSFSFSIFYQNNPKDRDCNSPRKKR